MADSRTTSPTDRVQLVSLLWEVRNAARRSNDNTLGVVHFNLLLSDPRYRREMLDRGRVSTCATLRRLAMEAHRLDDGRSLKEERDPPASAGTPEPTASAPASAGEHTRRGSLWRWLAAGGTALVLGAVGLAGASQWLIDDGPTVETVSGSLFGDVVWRSDRVYRLTGLVFVESGSSLSIEPGTRIEGERGSALVVTRDGLLNARGERYNPVVFTSARPEGEQQAGDWGGVVLLGSAPINTGTGHIEGIPADDPRGGFGGSDVHHNCGFMQYARIEFAGYEISANNELNGLTVGGCGDATVLRYIQVHAGLDDGIEFFGGTANLSHAVITDADDDSLDWDRGWQGNGQFLVIKQSAGAGDNGFEADNLGDDHLAQPRSAPTLANVSILGPGEGNGAQRGMVLRRGTGLDLRNTLITDMPGDAIDIRDSATVEQIERGALRFDGVLVARSDRGSAFSEELGEGDDDGGFDEDAFFTEENGVHRVGPLMLSIADAATSGLALVPPSDTAFEDWAVSLPKGEFWDESATFIGAVRPGSRATWLEGWTRSIDRSSP